MPRKNKPLPKTALAVFEEVEKRFPAITPPPSKAELLALYEDKILEQMMTATGRNGEPDHRARLAAIQHIRTVLKEQGNPEPPISEDVMALLNEPEDD